MGKRRTKISEKKLKKQAFWKKLWKLLDEYDRVLIVKCDNVGSKQFQEIRHAIRPLGAQMLMGKNTLMKSGILRKLKDPEEGEFDFELRKDKDKGLPELERLCGILKGNSGLIFCRDNMAEVEEQIAIFKRETGAKIGMVAPSDVFIPAGPTGLDPKQTAFFQALNIQTKIAKTQIDILNEVHLIEEGKKIGASECALLDKLGIRPFAYEMTISHVYDSGSIFSADVLKIKDEDIFAKFRNGCQNLAALSIQAGYPNKISAPHSVIRGFKQLVSLSIDQPFSFPQGEHLKVMAENPDQFAVKEEKVEEKKEEVKKEEVVEEPEKKEPEVVGVGNIFGEDEEDDW